MKFTRELLGRKNQKGVALLIAIFTVVIITYLVSEILYDTNVEYVVNSGSINRLKAYYAAKSGMELSLLRIKIYGKVQKQFGGQIPPAQKKMLDLGWSFPFAWPPLLPAEASGVDKDLIQDKIKQSTLDSTYVVTISDEGSKIDLNDLASPSRALRDITKRLLLQIFEGRLKNDEDWARDNAELRYEEVINNIVDWVDPDSIALNGGDERALYGNLKAETPLPPNRGFRTIDELRMVSGMTEEIYSMLKDRVTVYGMRAINPNHARPEVLKALDPSITDEIVGKITSRRDDPTKGPFVDENDFWGFVNGEGGAVSPENQKAIPLVFDQVLNFRIRSIGQFANVTREIEAVVFDFSAVASSIASRLKREAMINPSPEKDRPKTNEPLPKGPPRIVYLIER